MYVCMYVCMNIERYVCMAEGADAYIEKFMRI